VQAAGLKMIRVSVADMPNEAALKALMAVMPRSSTPSYATYPDPALTAAPDADSRHKAINDRIFFADRLE